MGGYHARESHDDRGWADPVFARNGDGCAAGVAAWGRCCQTRLGRLGVVERVLERNRMQNAPDRELFVVWRFAG